jgi:tripartite-type tricarboxylate transporter receptor subunit TctC
MMFSAANEAIPFVTSDKTKGLAVTSLERISTLPNLPTMNEAAGVKNFEATFWLALVAPAGMDKGLQTRISSAMRELGKDDELRQRLNQLGIDLVTSTPEVVTANLKSDEEKWTTLIRSIKIN